ncbi:MAG TPA: glyceraldehyde 3-phosphate dehydrogenase NAD-binding domain-containing protein [Planctomycetaceae bacterium]|nr:glyceraldehyde 3-phosphate dehydrogenase NAD-binding domain-containing protein [Planctomycetaceae bacterium]
MSIPGQHHEHIGHRQQQNGRHTPGSLFRPWAAIGQGAGAYPRPGSPARSGSRRPTDRRRNARDAVRHRGMVVNGKKVRVCAERDPRKLPWKDLGVEVALESRGFFRGREKDDKPGFDSHLKAGARKVVISAPAKGPDLTVVLGVNDNELTSEHTCISNASCTTNCLPRMDKVLQ